VEHGFKQNRERYQRDLVRFDETCMSEIQTRSCSKGAFGPWVGANSYQYDACMVGLALVHSRYVCRQTTPFDDGRYGPCNQSDTQEDTRE
jgi:hypothetical protein